MKGYIDLYVLPLPKKNLSAYRRIAQKFGKIIEDHGALEYREWVGDDLKVKFCAAFPSRCGVVSQHLTNNEFDFIMISWQGL